MLIKMLETRRGTPDGFAMRHYHEGVSYDLPEMLACSFLQAGYAVRTVESPEAQTKFIKDGYRSILAARPVASAGDAESAAAAGQAASAVSQGEPLGTSPDRRGQAASDAPREAPEGGAE